MNGRLTSQVDVSLATRGSNKQHARPSPGKPDLLDNVHPPADSGALIP